MYGQKSKYKQFNNTLSLVVSPAEETGIGIKYTYKIIYCSASRGSYKLPDSGLLDDHYKLSAGYVKQFNIDRMIKTSNFYSFGLSYHYYGRTYYKTLAIDTDELFPVSFEIGAGARLGRMSGMFVFDPMKWECSICFGISF